MRYKMKEKDLNLLLQKADELRALFILGQRVIPFLEEIFVFVKEIQPLLDEINKSVSDNLNKMPNASEQLSKVTQANEMATVEIMDVVDGILYKIDLMESNNKTFFATKTETLNNSIKLLDILRRGIINGSDLKPAIPVINNTMKNLDDLNTHLTTDYLAENTKMLNEIRNDSNSIIMALQIQDITAQQIAAVNHMLGTIQTKLLTILKHFSSTNIEDLVKSDVIYHDNTVNVSTLHREIAFDPNAVDALSKKDNRQQNVDDLVNAHHLDESGFGQEHKVVELEDNAEDFDIDKLFSNANNNNAEVDTLVGNEDIDSLLNSVQFDKSNYNDTPENNTLVNNSEMENKSINSNLLDLSQYDNSDGDFSQDDIDALFK